MCNYAGIAAETAHGIAQGAAARCHDFPTEEFDRTIAINCRGVWLCCKYALKQMLVQEPREANARGEKTRGWIVNAASMLGVIGLANTPAYTTSKHAVINALCPGFVQSPMIQHYTDNPETKATLAAQHPWNALGRAEDIADAALFLASDEA
ncbi:hypothetical protein LTR17_006760 [Elasticomyces elasticus]|nr:hypothetical protein LTR17_006760 [Elasticomyces elasticus]